MNRNSRQLEVPPELTSLLLDFTVSVLVNKPADIVEYAAQYFARRRDERTSGTVGRNVTAGSVDSAEDEDGDSFAPDFSK